MKLGHPIPMVSGAEYDVFTPWRRLYCYLQRPGICKAIKRQYNKRARRAATLQIRREASE